jgi:hypothetical protein
MQQAPSAMAVAVGRTNNKTRNATSFGSEAFKASGKLHFLDSVRPNI